MSGALLVSAASAMTIESYSYKLPYHIDRMSRKIERGAYHTKRAEHKATLRFWRHLQRYWDSHPARWR